jgi:hypothetical protein
MLVHAVPEEGPIPKLPPIPLLLAILNVTPACKSSGEDTPITIFVRSTFLFWAYRFVENETNNIVAAIKYFMRFALG